MRPRPLGGPRIHARVCGDDCRALPLAEARRTGDHHAMRVPVRIGSTELLLHDNPSAHTSRSEFQPVSRSQARDLLARLSLTPSLMSELRRSVGARELPVSRMTNAQLLEHLAGRMASGLLWLDTLAPAWRPTSISADKAETEKAPESEPEVRKPWPPDPLVPPEYITSAWLESNAVRAGRNFLCDKLDGLMYMGFVVDRPTSSVAPEYRAAARLKSGEVRNAASEMNLTLTNEMYEPAVLSRPESAIAKSYVETARQQAAQIRESAAHFALELVQLVG
jgi:hypothetical protein